MLKSLFKTASLLALAGCTTVDDLRALPPLWTATYPVAFDTMANCLAIGLAEGHVVTPQLYQRERRAIVTASVHGIGPPMFVTEYTVRQISETDSAVSVRSTFKPGGLLGGPDRSRALADRCARGD